MSNTKELTLTGKIVVAFMMLTMFALMWWL